MPAQDVSGLRPGARGLRHRGGIPVLDVADATKASAYYQRFFGFSEVTSDGPGGTALLQGHGVMLQLRAGGPGRDRDGLAPVPDAVILVDRPEQLERELDDLGAHLIGAGELGAPWQSCFGFRDCYRNVIAVGPAAGARPMTRRLLGEPVDAVRFALRERQRSREESRHLAEFRAFYESLPDKRDIYYMLFTGGLLHWVRKAVSFVPEHVNLVLLGSDLPADDLAWATERSGRPFHHIRVRLDEAAGWEFLFAVNRGNFGWIAPGCFVLNPQVIDELSRLGSASALNCAWSWDSGSGFPIASPHLVFVNGAGIAALRARQLPASPGVYAYRRMNRQVEGRRCYTQAPSRAQLRLLGQVLPSDGSGRPQVPGNLPFFDTTMMYQLLARACGFEVARTRELRSLGHVHGGAVEDESSDELFYIGALGYADVLEEFSGYFHDSGVRLLYLIAEFVVLAGTARDLPSSYGSRLEQVTAELARSGLSPPEARAAARGHLMETRGMSATAADAVLRGL